MPNKKPYDVCPNCGAHLDHGERCDCQKKAEDQNTLEYLRDRIVWLIDRMVNSGESYKKALNRLYAVADRLYVTTGAYDVYLSSIESAEKRKLKEAILTASGQLDTEEKLYISGKIQKTALEEMDAKQSMNQCNRESCITDIVNFLNRFSDNDSDLFRLARINKFVSDTFRDSPAARRYIGG